MAAGDSKDSRVLEIRHRNPKGEIAIRRVVPIGNVRFASTEWHPDPQWLIDVLDVDKGVARTFALEDMCPIWAPESAQTVYVVETEKQAADRRFSEYLSKCHDEVSRWPAHMRNLLGKIPDRESMGSGGW